MVTSLTSRIHEIINQLEKFPNDPMDMDIAVPYQLLKKSNQFFIQEASKEKKGDSIIRSEIQSNRVEDVIKRILFKGLSVGVTYSSNPKLVEDSTQYVLKYIIQNYPVHLSWSPVNLGVQYPNQEVEKLDSQVRLTRLELVSPWEELYYGIENSLFSWNGESWRISPLGKFFKSLSIPTGTVFLLMLENYLNVPERKTPFNINPWHTSKAFLKALIERGKSNVDIGEGIYDLSDYDPNMYFINRLDQFQLTNTIDLTEEHRSMPDEVDGIAVLHIADHFYETTLTKYGKEIVTRVLDESPSILRSVIENLTTFELSGQEYFNTTDKAVIKELEDLTKKNPEIIGDQDEPIKDICRDLSEKIWDVLTLRSIPPTIEKVLKNILIEIGEIDRSNSTITLGGIIKKLEALVSTGTNIIPFDTIQYVRHIDRNSLLHGSISPNGGIRESLINLMVNVLIKILEDYALWKSTSNKHYHA